MIFFILEAQPSKVSGFCFIMADYWSGLIPRSRSLGLTLNEGVRSKLQLTIGPDQFETTMSENSQPRNVQFLRSSSRGLTLNEGVRSKLQLTIGPD